MQDENAPVNNFADFYIDIFSQQAPFSAWPVQHNHPPNLSRNPSIIGSNPAIQRQAVYEVIISFTGYTSLYGDNTKSAASERRSGCTEWASVWSRKMCLR